MKPPILKLEKDIDTVQFMPLNILIERFKELVQLPYDTRFSFLPFIRKMNERVAHTNCEMTAAMIPQIEELEARTYNKNGKVDEEALKEIDYMVNALLPSMFFDGEHSFICPPFTKEHIYKTPSLEDLHNGDKWLVKMDILKLQDGIVSPTQHAASFILNTFYGQKIENLFNDVVTFKNVETDRERHYKLLIREDFIKIEVNGELPELTTVEINDLINNLDKDEVVLSYLPKDKFSFKGFGIGVFTDITELEIQSQIKDITTNVSEVVPNEFTAFLQIQLRNFLDRNDIDVGFADLYFENTYGEFDFSLSGLIDLRDIVSTIINVEDSIGYQKAYITKKPLIIEDLDLIEKLGEAELGLKKNGYRSVILIPVKDGHGKIASIFEIASKKAYGFNNLDLIRLAPIINQLDIGNEAFLKEFDNKINQFIQNQFTSIHPSVEWRFQEVATKYEVLSNNGNEDVEIDEIVFKDVYPLYGQADIVNSSNIRNEAIRLDLQDNLERLINLLEALEGSLNIHLLDSYKLKAEEALAQLEDGYTSSIESFALDLLTKEAHPLLKQMEAQYTELEIPKNEIEKYFSGLDEGLGIVYLHRQAYEMSVTKLNNTISSYIGTEDKKMQKNLPHYFEKYKTDGTEYNIYLGQSLLKNIKFSDFHLKDFRLWQLINICEVTRIVSNLKNNLPVPLETAQLIFVYNTPLSIRFRMDEKQFDVDGTYNVRYEILKKRIDKSLIKGTSERLTQAGKVAIVYLLEKDKQEYMEYLQYLVKKGYIKGEIEDLELEKLQGADGLKALRVEVIG